MDGPDRREKDLCERAWTQDGFFTAEQAMALGFTGEDVVAAVAAGTWAQPEPGLFRLAQWRTTDLEDVARCCVRLDNAVVSHQSAAELHGLGHLHPRFLHVTTTASETTRLDRVAVHHSAMPPGDCEHTGAFRITTPMRTVFDLADGGVSQWVLDEVVGDALAIGRIDRDALGSAAVGRSERVERRVTKALSAWE
ncbi:hypothetical protein FK531_12070 [Rhodococcus spelaei]|uniref:AbiEi antitoxin C-terminal domain-containing protein n=1 Tax=Rhodococcus spelaei TaxID=2546320 RepID=A0A541B8B4_9NOCA|nr:type IV toxin-antitoxin system AbiEi family antitoxin domain-containing protein [Rhodococcus spelaei]TQF68556.1 hypothetical protein FK531_12070 [Rhodococcus spelaei]